MSFRQALGSYATGVALITAAVEGGEAAAITVNSFASVSLEPKLVLWSLGDKSDAYPVFSVAEHWGVSIVRAEDEEVARKYATNGRANAPGSMLVNLGGAPVFKNALSAFGCRTHERKTQGDHLLIIGEVIDFSGQAGAALSFYRGKFGSIGP